MNNRQLRFRVWDGIDYMSTPFTLKELQEKKVMYASNTVVMQYTGLKDKNGKEIYESDICKLFSCNRQIEFQEGSFGYMTELNNENGHFVHISNHNFGWVNGKSDKIEVIGNIYQNPELLTQ